VSGALNDFSQAVVRHVVESEYLGRVIYAGGDDVLAMLPVADLLGAMQRLRHAYSGTLPEDEHSDWGALRPDRKALHCKNGFAYLNGRLLRMMGRHATASTGAVIAHHQAPLSAVLRELRAAEKRAKAYRRPDEDGQWVDRDAFSITVIKRSGGALHLTEKWGEPVALLDDSIGFLADLGVSRRAVYNSLEWLTDLPDPKAQPEMLHALLGYQLARQAQGTAKSQAPELARRLAACSPASRKGTASTGCATSCRWPNSWPGKRAPAPPPRNRPPRPREPPHEHQRFHRAAGRAVAARQQAVRRPRQPWRGADPALAVGGGRRLAFAHAGRRRRGSGGFLARGGGATPPGHAGDTGAFTVAGFHLARRYADGRAELLMAPPADLVVFEAEGDQRFAVQRMAPTAPAAGLASSAELPLLPVLAQADRRKPAGGYWLTEAGCQELSGRSRTRGRNRLGQVRRAVAVRPPRRRRAGCRPASGQGRPVVLDAGDRLRQARARRRNGRGFSRHRQRRRAADLRPRAPGR
jgi:hypothetical protein